MKKGFYFHQYANGTYKSGTWKGMDLTFGNVEQNIYYGILIRAIYDIDRSVYIEGPCKSVNYLMDQLSVQTVKELADLAQSEFKVVYDEHIQKYSISHAPRIGLSDKYPEYKDKLYRFVIMNHIKKEKSKLIPTSFN